ncbi:MAG: hypothetical protein MHM6MM_002164 [Cercozoa sp. M6MM]
MSEQNEEVVRTQLLQKWRQMKAELKQAYAKLNDVNIKLNEHSLVCRTMSDLEDDRVCYHLVGGVLVQETVATALPKVQANRDNLSMAVEKMTEQIRMREKLIDEFEDQHNLREAVAQAQAQNMHSSELERRNVEAYARQQQQESKGVLV